MVAPGNPPLPGLIALDEVVAAMIPGSEQYRYTIITHAGEFCAAVTAAQECDSILKIDKQATVAFDPARAHIIERR